MEWTSGVTQCQMNRSLPEPNPAEAFGQAFSVGIMHARSAGCTATLPLMLSLFFVGGLFCASRIEGKCCKRVAAFELHEQRLAAQSSVCQPKRQADCGPPGCFCICYDQVETPRRSSSRSAACWMLVYPACWQAALLASLCHVAGLVCCTAGQYMRACRSWHYLCCEQATHLGSWQVISATPEPVSPYSQSQVCDPVY